MTSASSLPISLGSIPSTFRNIIRHLPCPLNVFPPLSVCSGGGVDLALHWFPWWCLPLQHSGPPSGLASMSPFVFVLPKCRLSLKFIFQPSHPLFEIHPHQWCIIPRSWFLNHSSVEFPSPSETHISHYPLGITTWVCLWNTKSFSVAGRGRRGGGGAREGEGQENKK